jgi:choline dehydrogenase
LRDYFDAIVVGGGSAGCVVASRMSENDDVSVLLLEAGPDPQPLPDVITTAKRDAEALLQSPYVAMYPTKRSFDDSSFPLLAGRIIGGGSSVNFMSTLRPTAADCGRWQLSGGPAWSYASLLQLMRQVEHDYDFPDDPLHGNAGPISVSRSFDPDWPMAEAPRAFFESALALGLPYCRDLNVPEPFGIGPTPSAILDGRRQSTAVAYLAAARERPNLTVRDEAMVIDVQARKGHVAGVRYVRDGSICEARADRVVISAGVFQSPSILLRSGIGPVDELRRVGVGVIHPLAGVGANLQDHATVFVTFEGRESFGLDGVLPKFRILAKSDRSRVEPDLNVFMRQPAQIRGLGALVPVSVHLLEHRRTGRLRLGGSDPAAAPELETSMLDDPEDVRSIVKGIALVADLCMSDGMERWYGPMVQPAPGDDLVTYVRSTFTSYDHGVGTCRIGPADDPAAVVDGSLRVHGFDNLWVADASVLPVIPHVNTNLSAVLVGESAARSIAADLAGGAPPAPSFPTATSPG